MLYSIEQKSTKAAPLYPDSIRVTDARSHVLEPRSEFQNLRNSLLENFRRHSVLETRKNLGRLLQILHFVDGFVTFTIPSVFTGVSIVQCCYQLGSIFHYEQSILS